MNPLSVVAVAILAVVFVNAAFPVAHTMRFGGPLDDLQQHGSLLIAAVSGIAALLLPNIKGLFPAGKDGESKGVIGSFIAWFMGLAGSKPLGFAAQLVAFLEMAILRKKEPPAYFEGDLYWDDGDKIPISFGLKPPAVLKAMQPAPKPTPTPAPAPAPKPAAATPAPATPMTTA